VKSSFKLSTHDGKRNQGKQRFESLNNSNNTDPVSADLVDGPWKSLPKKRRAAV